MVGMRRRKALALSTGLLIGVNHLEGHLYSARIQPDENETPPRISVGCPDRLRRALNPDLMKNHQEYEQLGGTLDDAAGKAFDKVARLLGLPYHGGPSIRNPRNAATQRL